MFFYGKLATLAWDPDHWRWVEDYYFLHYTTKFGRDLVINTILGMAWMVDK